MAVNNMSCFCSGRGEDFLPQKLL